MNERIDAAERMTAFAREGRLIQNAWHGDRDGRELACLLGAIGPDVSDPSDCPASVMPEWLAHLLPTLFDNVRSKQAVEFGLRFAEALRAKPVGDAVRDRWLARVVELARDAAQVAQASAAWRAAAADAAADAARTADAAAYAADAAAYAAADAAYAADEDADDARIDAYETMFDRLIEEMEA